MEGPYSHEALLFTCTKLRATLWEKWTFGDRGQVVRAYHADLRRCISKEDFWSFISLIKPEVLGLLIDRKGDFLLSHRSKIHLNVWDVSPISYCIEHFVQFFITIKWGKVPSWPREVHNYILAEANITGKVLEKQYTSIQWQIYWAT